MASFDTCDEKMESYGAYGWSPVLTFHLLLLSVTWELSPALRCWFDPTGCFLFLNTKSCRHHHNLLFFPSSSSLNLPSNRYSCCTEAKKGDGGLRKQLTDVTGFFPFSAVLLHTEEKVRFNQNNLQTFHPDMIIMFAFFLHIFYYLIQYRRQCLK
jgi:hypothetical protein